MKTTIFIFSLRLLPRILHKRKRFLLMEHMLYQKMNFLEAYNKNPDTTGE